MKDQLYKLLISFGIPEAYAGIANKGLLLVLALIVSFLADLIARKVLLTIIQKVSRRTSTVWDDIIVEQGVFNRLAHIAPALVLYFSMPFIFPSVDLFSALIQRIVLVYMIGVILMMLNSLLSAINGIYRTYEISKSRPIKGYLQIVRVFIYIVGVTLMITTLLDKSALGLLSGIGALSAVIMLVFKDSILGLVAAVQLSGNDMIRIGDWISVPSYGADGDVIDIKLQTVTVQNFDKTIVQVPIYSLVSSSFKNWRGMSDSGGRRIKRSLALDMKSIKFCSPEMIERFKKIDVLGDYIEKKQAEIDEDNQKRKANTAEMINGRRMTNIGVFRAYVSAYLKEHPMIHDEMTFLVRQLQSTDKGVPIEIYVFSKDQAWANYEAIQADIFDHLMATVDFFELAIYQSPSSLDLRESLSRK